MCGYILQFKYKWYLKAFAFIHYIWGTSVLWSALIIFYKIFFLHVTLSKTVVTLFHNLIRKGYFRSKYECNFLISIIFNSIIRYKYTKGSGKEIADISICIIGKSIRNDIFPKRVKRVEHKIFGIRWKMPT